MTDLHLRDVVASNLRALKARARWSDAAVARRAGLSRSTVNDRMRGARPCTVDELEHLAHAFGVTVESLLDPPAPLALVDPPTGQLELHLDGRREVALKVYGTTADDVLGSGLDPKSGDSERETTTATAHRGDDPRRIGPDRRRDTRRRSG